VFDEGGLVFGVGDCCYCGFFGFDLDVGD